MPNTAFLALETTGLALFLLALVRRLPTGRPALAPDAFQRVATTAALFAACDATGLRTAAGLLHAAAWLRQSRLGLAHDRSEGEGWLEALLWAAALAAALPDVVPGGRPRLLAGAVVTGLGLGTLWLVAARYARAGRHGVRHARVHLGALVILLGLGAAGLLAQALAWPSAPLLLDAAIAASLALAAYGHVSASADALAQQRPEAIEEERDAQPPHALARP